ncbi:MAG: hypothetical protein LBN07_03855 [Christensenellaceae bacterium]|nr:hypothetical protein [Christensenellaceae bacterium]
MYTMYKYSDILHMESTFAKHFAELSPSKKIIICPPVLKKHGIGYVLAYLVIPEPLEISNRSSIRRPIGAIYRNKKNKRIIKIISCKNHEFTYDHDSFEHEYYDLQNYPDFWPNRNRENEEQFKLALEQLYRVVSEMKPFGGYNKERYTLYKNRIKHLFPMGYLYFFTALEKNEFRPVTNELARVREQARQAHQNEEVHRNQVLTQETETQRILFIKAISENIQLFVRKEILPSLKKKTPYTRLDFYEYLGKTIKKLYINTQEYQNCYSPTLSIKQRQKNESILQETIKVNLIKTYAKACVKPLINDSNANNVATIFLKMLHIMALQEKTGKDNDKIREDMSLLMQDFKEELKYTETASAKNEFNSYFNMLYKDYYESEKPEEFSELYLGYTVANLL